MRNRSAPLDLSFSDLEYLEQANLRLMLERND